MVQYIVQWVISQGHFKSGVSFGVSDFNSGVTLALLSAYDETFSFYNWLALQNKALMEKLKP